VKQRYGAIREAFGTAALWLLFLYFIVVGVYTLWEQHHGVPAWVTVGKCHLNKPVVCSGVWRRDGSENGSPVEETIRIEGVGYEDVGHDVAVHIHPGSGDALFPLLFENDDKHHYATADSSSGVVWAFGVACVLGVPAIVLIVRRRRQPKVFTDRPSLGPTEFPPPHEKQR
jgi:hypothetical protein